MRLGLVLFVRGPLRPHAEALANLFQCVRITTFGQSLRKYRYLSDVTWRGLSWRDLPGTSAADDFARLFDYPNDKVGSWGVELMEQSDEGDAALRNYMEIADLVPSLDAERASYVRLIFDERTPLSEIASLVNWSVNNFPFWWGSAGWFFHHIAGRSYPAYAEIAAKAKRYWAVQIQNLTALQWDALRGMPGVNWLSLIGREFAAEKDVELELLASEATKGLGIFLRQGASGLVLAAGSRPTKGDVNVGEGVAAYKAIAKLIAPFLLAEQTPLSGPFKRPDVMAAWLGRFKDPRSWTECDIAD